MTGDSVLWKSSVQTRFLYRYGSFYNLSVSIALVLSLHAHIFSLSLCLCVTVSLSLAEELFTSLMLSSGIPFVSLLCTHKLSKVTSWKSSLA